MKESGVHILKLDIENLASFSFRTPNTSECTLYGIFYTTQIWH